VVSCQPISDRLLLARFAHKHRHLSIIVLYAPTHLSEDHDKDNFYNQLSAATQSIPPHDIFQRLLVIGKARTDEYDIHQLLQYELSPSPPALFDEYGLLRQAIKTQHAESLSQRLPTLMTEVDIIPIFTVMMVDLSCTEFSGKKTVLTVKSVNSM